MAEKTYDELVGQVRVAYIGNKEVKKDTIARTGVEWFGFGDIQVVDARAASLLLRHKTVWCKAEELPAIAEQIAKAAEEKPAPAAEPESAPAPQAEPEDAADNAKMDALQKAILNLDQASPEHYTEKGKPRIEAVRALLPEGMDATVAEVNAAFKALGGE